MSEAIKPAEKFDSPIKIPAGAESPTTARPLEMDDDDIPEACPAGGDAPNAFKQATVDDEPPAKPPRPLSPQQQAENTLKEAFPSIDAAIVKAVLTASGGLVEPAFNALLGMSDPDAARESSPPPQPPRPTTPQVGSTSLSQLEADEQYARQLAEQYGGGSSGNSWSRPPRTSSRGIQPQRTQTGLRPNEAPEERSFLEDELPIIKDSLKKGFIETQNRVNTWITNLKKKIDGEDEEDNMPHGYGSYSRPRRSHDNARRSGDYNRYDADPQVLSDDFAGIQLNPDGAAARHPTRPVANPDLFKTKPASPKSVDGRKVSSQGRPAEEVDIYPMSPRLRAKENVPAATTKPSKWQPLSTVDSNPMGETDNDPFSLGDSDDEKESKDRLGGKEVKLDDTERLKKAAAEAMASTIGGPSKKPEVTESVGNRGQVADEKPTGKFSEDL